MAENNASSQESLPLSQETCQQLFSLIGCPLSNLLDDNSETSHMQDETYDDLINNVSRIAPTGVNVQLNGCSRNNAIQQQFIQDENRLPEETQWKVESIDFKSVSISSQYPQSSLPASEDWPGDFNFSVLFFDQKDTKGVSSWIFSPEQNKLYVSKGAACPFNFTTGNYMPEQAFIRAMVLFSSSEHGSEKVTRCVNHSIEELKRGIFEAEHFVRCESLNAIYENDPATDRHSVIVPYENPPAGQLFSTYLFKFMCFGSCAGGPNRRPLMIVFTLEKRGEVIGRKKLDLKVSACPVRDFKQADKKAYEFNKPVNNKSNGLNIKPIKRPTDQILSQSKKIKKEDEKIYTIQVKGRRCYKFLKRMQGLHTVYSIVKNKPQWKQFLYTSSQSSSSEDTDVH